MATFGDTDSTNSGYIQVYDTYTVTRFTTGSNLTEDGTVSKISALISVDSANNATYCKCAIYDNAGALVSGSETAEVNVQAADTNPHWYDFTLLTPKALVAGTYRLVLWGDEGANSTWPRHVYGTGVTGGTYNSAALTYVTGTGNWPATIGTTGYSTGAYHIYATYTAGGGASTTPAKMDTYRRRRMT
jgi:hypothetical protein